MRLNGKPVAERIKNTIAERTAEFRGIGIVPKLSILRVGNRSDDVAYEQRLLKNCEDLGIEAESRSVDENIDMESFLKALEELNDDDTVHGILIFRPLPKQLDEAKICTAISPLKDVDCMNPINTEKVFSGDRFGFAPCTPEAVVEVLKFYGYNLIEKKVCIVNRSMVLGRPLAMLLLGEDSTVTVCHSKTKDLHKVTSDADIVITGIGKANYFTPMYFGRNSVVIDVGINFENDVMCGDVEFESVSKCVHAITPVPGGIGAVTSALLLQHVIRAIEIQQQLAL